MISFQENFGHLSLISILMLSYHSANSSGREASCEGAMLATHE